ncbi:HD domain-containing protein [Spiroplasma turonicum]|uniref:HD superfamily phosphohydrolase n=1 Tax=Spiroplasma turonicum TaxID=216946 RepID=A0A0K1P7M3_9MOLU|nr:HD domain-containing protein [Spiroplasma turonicum]AKU80298.1 HD superfamily phosphohydrolase [Spiroplasma turonicum]ALX71299.1 HD superfamily phosphohydrolase [Spiroplasma turonicum]
MKKFIRDNVHGEISINEDFIIELIESKAFQRLRRIIQLGGGQFVFPSASHTRFSHSIGVYHVICKFLENESVFKSLNSNEIKALKCAGLLHDIGHGPFSHSFEKVINQKHEEFSKRIIHEDYEINNILNKYSINPKEVTDIIEGKHKNLVLSNLVSSQIDADRIDYLLRDSIGAGVNYSKLDLQWIIRHTMVHDNKIVFPEKTVNSIEHFLLGRYHMFLQVYHHKISKAFDFTLEKWFERLKFLFKKGFSFKNTYFIEVLKNILEDKKLSVEDYLRLDDYTVIEFIKQSEEENDFILKDLASRILNRSFVSVSSSIDEEQYNTYKSNFPYDTNYYFGIMKESSFNIYEGDKSDYSKDIFILSKDEIKPITEVSKILVSVDINKKFYIFVKNKVE